MPALLDLVSRYTRRHADCHGIARTPIPGLQAIRATTPSTLNYDIYRPLVCLVLQGRKEVALGTEIFSLSAGNSLLITADLPTLSRITQASPGAPYLALALELDLDIIDQLVRQMPTQPSSFRLTPIQSDPTEAETADAALRLMRLLDRPEALPILSPPIIREIHYWLLTGRHGAAIQRLGRPGSHAHRIARTVALLRTEYARPLPIDHLAATAGMSPSSFHHHFRQTTSLSPLQFQKHLRLIEARRLMRSEGFNASSAAYAVGYESVSQFTREYGRLFGLPPAQDSRRPVHSPTQPNRGGAVCTL